VCILCDRYVQKKILKLFVELSVTGNSAAGMQQRTHGAEGELRVVLGSTVVYVVLHAWLSLAVPFKRLGLAHFMRRKHCTVFGVRAAWFVC
jgi:hypothetical protein